MTDPYFPRNAHDRHSETQSRRSPGQHQHQHQRDHQQQLQVQPHRHSSSSSSSISPSSRPHPSNAISTSPNSGSSSHPPRVHPYARRPSHNPDGAVPKNSANASAASPLLSHPHSQRDRDPPSFASAPASSSDSSASSSASRIQLPQPNSTGSFGLTLSKPFSTSPRTSIQPISIPGISSLALRSPPWSTSAGSPYRPPFLRTESGESEPREGDPGVGRQRSQGDGGGVRGRDGQVQWRDPDRPDFSGSTSHSHRHQNRSLSRGRRTHLPSIHSLSGTGGSIGDYPSRTPTPTSINTPLSMPPPPPTGYSNPLDMSSRPDSRIRRSLSGQSERDREKDRGRERYRDQERDRERERGREQEREEELGREWERQRQREEEQDREREREREREKERDRARSGSSVAALGLRPSFHSPPIPGVSPAYSHPNSAAFSQSGLQPPGRDEVGDTRSAQLRRQDSSGSQSARHQAAAAGPKPGYGHDASPPLRALQPYGPSSSLSASTSAGSYSFSPDQYNPYPSPSLVHGSYPPQHYRGIGPTRTQSQRRIVADNQSRSRSQSQSQNENARSRRPSISAGDGRERKHHIGHEHERDFDQAPEAYRQEVYAHAHESRSRGPPPGIYSPGPGGPGAPASGTNAGLPVGTGTGGAGQSRRIAHLMSEQKRRESINEGFQALRGVTPTAAPADSKAVVLRKAASHILYLEEMLRAATATATAGAGAGVSAAGSSSVAVPKGTVGARHEERGLMMPEEGMGVGTRGGFGFHRFGGDTGREEQYGLPGPDRRVDARGSGYRDKGREEGRGEGEEKEDVEMADGEAEEEDEDEDEDEDEKDELEEMDEDSFRSGDNESRVTSRDYAGQVKVEYFDVQGHGR